MLAVPFENDRYDSTAMVRLYDVNNATAQIKIGGDLFRSRGDYTQASTAAVTKLSNGQFLLFVTGKDTKTYEHFVSRGTAPSSTFDSIGSGSTGFPAYQSLAFVTGCDGTLYLVGTNRNSNNEDWVDIWQVTFNAGSYTPNFTKKGNRHLYCSDGATGNSLWCNFSAGGGTFVAPNGRLIVYGTEHFNDGPQYMGPATTVKFREFSSF